MPQLRWPAILAGIALAVAISLLSGVTLPPIPAAAASYLGLAVSGLLAGKLAIGARAYHGALVGAGYVVCEALGIVPSRSYSADPLSDTVTVIVSDALAIAAATLGGWSARLSSSSDTGRGR